MVTERGGASLNYKYLRKKDWYRAFRLVLAPFYLAIIPLNMWHAWRWRGEQKFDWLVFGIGIFISIAIIYLIKFLVVFIVEGKKAYLPPWNK